MSTHMLPRTADLDDTAYTLTETPLDCAVRVLMHAVPAQDWRWYRDQVQAILRDGRADRSHVERRVIDAYNKRVSEWRRSRREWVL